MKDDYQESEEFKTALKHIKEKSFNTYTPVDSAMLFTKSNNTDKTTDDAINAFINDCQLVKNALNQLGSFITKPLHWLVNNSHSSDSITLINQTYGEDGNLHICKGGYLDGSNNNSGHYHLIGTSSLGVSIFKGGEDGPLSTNEAKEVAKNNHLKFSQAA